MNQTVQTHGLFSKSCRVWFPDFEEMMEAKERRYQKYAQPLTGMLAMLSYFRGEIPRDVFLSRFSSQKSPKKILGADREVYLRVQELCAAYQNNMVSDADFDEQVLLAFRSRPTEDVFKPSFEQWEEVRCLISRLERKMSSMPLYFDGIAWNTYLTGKITRKQYVEIFLASGPCDYLAQLLAYGTDKKELAEKYAPEISACRDLQALCMAYRAGAYSPDFFDARFLELAKLLCEAISQ